MSMWKSRAQEVLEVVSEPAMSWVRASAVSSARPSFSPFSSLPSMRRASRSTRLISPRSAASRRALTRAMAIPARFWTASTPFVKKGSMRYLA